jgi:hypothetical protein
LHGEIYDLLGWMSGDLLAWLQAETKVPGLLSIKP